MAQLTQVSAAAPIGKNKLPPFTQTASPSAFMYALPCPDNCMTYAGPQLAGPGFAMESWIGNPDRKEMEAELNEHRYRLEHQVKRRTEQLARSMTLLESCNAALCDKLAVAQKELASLKRQLSGTVFGVASNDCIERPCIRLESPDEAIAQATA